MRSSNRQYFSSVDHIRAFAVLLVVFYHGAQLFGGAISGIPFGVGGNWLYTKNPLAAVIFEGHSAVALFMVLSGFIFTVGTLDHTVSFRRFMANRLLRIYPLFMLLIVIGVAANPAAFKLGGFLQLVGGLGNLPGAMHLGSVSLMFWAVAIEMQFYLLFPLLNSLLTRFGMAAFARLLLAIVVVRGLIWAVSDTHDTLSMLYLSLAGRIDQFLLGMITAWLFVRHRDRFRGWWKVGVSLLLVTAALWSFNQVHGFVSNSPWRLAWLDVEGAVWALAILTYVATCRATNALSRATAKVGELSYSIYLLHFMLIFVINSQQWWVTVPGLSFKANALLTTLVVLVPLVVACSMVTYYGVELPFLRMRMKYLLPAVQGGESVASGDSVAGAALEANVETRGTRRTAAWHEGRAADPLDAAPTTLSPHDAPGDRGEGPPHDSPGVPQPRPTAGVRTVAVGAGFVEDGRS